MEHKVLETERGDVHYWVNSSESEDCIVFTHGLTADHRMFEKQVEFFEKKYRIVLWDVPMHGLSRPYSEFSYRNTAYDLNGILQRENIEKAVLVGMSMGGYPSQEYASIFPEKVSGFIALDTTPFGLGYYSASDKWWLRQVETMAAWFPEKMLRESMAKSVSKTEYSYNKMKEMLKDSDKKEIVKQMGIAYTGFLKENKDVKFDFPVLILLGEHDKTGKVRQYCEKWSENEGYPLHIIKNASHFSNGDNYQDVNKEIDEFIKNI
ncbi:MAG: alpha/beta hydrolase [Clostridia bacterium]|nr:alpha/beta hydrolase [Clostridia bacterium]